MAAAREVLTGAATRLWTALRAAPGTLIYLFTLLVTQLTLSTVDDHLGHKLLLSESTNLVNMKRVPVQVLIGSAFWIDGDALVTGVTLLAVLVVLVPLERWMGTWRWLVSIATGHIGATLLTLVTTTCLLRRGLLSPAVAHSSDVGVSYVLLTGVGLLVHAIRRRSSRLVVATLATAALVAQLVSDLEIVALGHLLSFLIGLSLFWLVPVARRVGRRRVTPDVRGGAVARWRLVPALRRPDGRGPDLGGRAGPAHTWSGRLVRPHGAGSPSASVSPGQVRLAASEES